MLLKMTRKGMLCFVLVLVYFSGSSSGFSYSPERRHHSCTRRTAGLPSCHFDDGFCGLWRSESLNGTDLSWKRAEKVKDSRATIRRDWQPRRTKNRKGSFVYLDVTDRHTPVGATSRLSGRIISSSVRAVCIEFQFASTTGIKSTHPYSGPAMPSVLVTNRRNDGTDVFIGKIREDTQGHWHTARFHSCVGKMSQISFESEKRGDSSFFALDYIHISNSTMDCPDEVESTTPVPTTTTTTTNTTTPPPTTKTPPPPPPPKTTTTNISAPEISSTATKDTYHHQQSQPQFYHVTKTENGEIHHHHHYHYNHHHHYHHHHCDCNKP